MPGRPEPDAQVEHAGVASRLAHQWTELRRTERHPAPPPAPPPATPPDRPDGALRRRARGRLVLAVPRHRRRRGRARLPRLVLRRGRAPGRGGHPHHGARRPRRRPPGRDGTAARRRGRPHGGRHPGRHRRAAQLRRSAGRRGRRRHGRLGRRGHRRDPGLAAGRAAQPERLPGRRVPRPGTGRHRGPQPGRRDLLPGDRGRHGRRPRVRRLLHRAVLDVLLPRRREPDLGLGRAARRRARRASGSTARGGSPGSR